MALINCRECGKQISNEADKCPNCGCPVNNTTATTDVLQQEKNVKKNKKGRGCLMFIIAIFLIVGIGGIIIQKSGITVNTNTKIILDAKQFSNIAVAELENIMGAPESVEDWTQTVNEQSFPAKTYRYENGRYEFVVIEDKVVRLNIYSPKYNDVNAEDFTYKKESDIFAMFGIKKGNDTTKIADTGNALRYQLVSDEINEVWIPSVDEANKTFSLIKITYNQMYFGNLLLNLDESNDLYIKCEETIKGLLQSPSTAKFPNITKWDFFKNTNGIYVQSYVDAQNGFGAEVRSEFQFIIQDNQVKSLIFDGQEMITQ